MLLVLLTGRTGTLPACLTDADEELLEEGVQGVEDDDGVAALLTDLLFFTTSLEQVGGRVRWLRIEETSGSHSFPSRTGGGPVRRFEDKEIGRAHV